MLDLVLIVSLAAVCTLGYWIMSKIDSCKSRHVVQYTRVRRGVKRNEQSGTVGVGA